MTAYLTDSSYFSFGRIGEISENRVKFGARRNFQRATTPEESQTSPTRDLRSTRLSYEQEHITYVRWSQHNGLTEQQRTARIVRPVISYCIAYKNTDKCICFALVPNCTFLVAFRARVARSLWGKRFRNRQIRDGCDVRLIRTWCVLLSDRINSSRKSKSCSSHRNLNTSVDITLDFTVWCAVICMEI